MADPIQTKINAHLAENPTERLSSTSGGLIILTDVLGTPDDDAGDPTVIGLLKQIAANTTPAE